MVDSYSSSAWMCKQFEFFVRLSFSVELRCTIRLLGISTPLVASDAAQGTARCLGNDRRPLLGAALPPLCPVRRRRRCAVDCRGRGSDGSTLRPCTVADTPAQGPVAADAVREVPDRCSSSAHGNGRYALCRIYADHGVAQCTTAGWWLTLLSVIDEVRGGGIRGGGGGWGRGSVCAPLAADLARRRESPVVRTVLDEPISVCFSPAFWVLVLCAPPFRAAADLSGCPWTLRRSTVCEPASSELMIMFWARYVCVGVVEGEQGGVGVRPVLCRVRFWRHLGGRVRGFVVVVRRWAPSPADANECCGGSPIKERAARPFSRTTWCSLIRPTPFHVLPPASLPPPHQHRTPAHPCLDWFLKKWTPPRPQIGRRSWSCAGRLWPPATRLWTTTLRHLR